MLNKTILLLLFITLFSCSKDDNSNCAEIEKQYLEALSYTGGNQAAIDQVKRQYEAKKREAGCN